MNALLVISSICLLLITQITAQEIQVRKPVDGINPDNAGTICFRANAIGQVVQFVADAENKCWYWQCVRSRRGVVLKAKRCALQTFVSSFFVTGNFNPCSEAYSVNMNKFDCTRKNINRGATPSCFTTFQLAGTCKNNGVIAFKNGKCWCQCPAGFAGFDCNTRTGEAGGSKSPGGPPSPISFGDPCPGGIPMKNWCGQTGVNPCQNGGQCINQCVDYVCQCTPPFTSGRNCEKFKCTAGFECLNGGTCDRGPSGNAEVARCDCAPGFRGVMCEIEV